MPPTQIQSSVSDSASCSSSEISSAASSLLSVDSRLGVAERDLGMTMANDFPCGISDCDDEDLVTGVGWLDDGNDGLGLTEPRPIALSGAGLDVTLITSLYDATALLGLCVTNPTPPGLPGVPGCDDANPSLACLEPSGMTLHRSHGSNFPSFMHSTTQAGFTTLYLANSIIFLGVSALAIMCVTAVLPSMYCTNIPPCVTTISVRSCRDGLVYPLTVATTPRKIRGLSWFSGRERRRVLRFWSLAFLRRMYVPKSPKLEGPYSSPFSSSKVSMRCISSE